jgi:AraC-like DNA-binding protein
MKTQRLKCKQLTLMITDSDYLKAVYSRALSNKCYGYLASTYEEAHKIAKIRLPHIIFIDQELPSDISNRLINDFSRDYPATIVVYMFEKTTLESLMEIWGKARELLQKPITEPAIKWIYEKYCLAPQCPTAPWRLVNQIINQRYADSKLRESDIAAELGMNPAYLSTVFRSVTGQSFKEAITNIRVGVARQLLLNNDLQVKEIAHRVGYPQVASFIRAFKHATQETPSDYRKRIQFNNHKKPASK